jgi:protein RhsD
MGMYVSQDPIRLTGRILNLYGYVCNTTYLCDPFGLVYQSHNHGDVNDSVTILRRQNIRNYQIEVHVDSHGPHIHLDRGTRQERYINISGMSNEQALRELPNKLRRESSVSAAINNALNY